MGSAEDPRNAQKFHATPPIGEETAGAGVRAEAGSWDGGHTQVTEAPCLAGDSGFTVEEPIRGLMPTDVSGCWAASQGDLTLLARSAAHCVRLLCLPRSLHVLGSSLITIC